MTVSAKPRSPKADVLPFQVLSNIMSVSRKMKKMSPYSVTCPQQITRDITKIYNRWIKL